MRTMIKYEHHHVLYGHWRLASGNVSIWLAPLGGLPRLSFIFTRPPEDLKTKEKKKRVLRSLSTFKGTSCLAFGGPCRRLVVYCCTQGEFRGVTSAWDHHGAKLRGRVQMCKDACALALTNEAAQHTSVYSRPAAHMNS